MFVQDSTPCKLDYVVVCNSGWRTESARVSGIIGNRQVDMNVSVDAQQRWHVNGTELHAVAGCLDIDLGFTPSTNLLPIRRLALNVGDQADVTAAWLPFPSLVFEVLPQVYRREGANTYRYESGGGKFVRVLEVNAEGFVTSYPGLWQAESDT